MRQMFSKMSMYTFVQSVNQKNWFIIALVTTMLPVIICAFSPHYDVEISEPVSEFVSTSLKIGKDRKMTAPLYTAKLHREQINGHFFNISMKIADSFGYPDPNSFGDITLKALEYYPPLTNHDLEISAIVYAIGRLLERKGLLPDVNTAVEKSGELIQRLQNRIDELEARNSWKDRLLALYEGFDLFFKHNDGMSPAEFLMMIELFTGQVVKARSA